MINENNNKVITREFLISDVQKLIKETKQTPILYTYKFKNQVLKEFTSWKDLLKIVKLRMKKANKQKMFNQEYANNELIKKAQKLAKELNRIPDWREFEFQFEAIKSFGTWNNFLKEAGLNNVKQGRSKKNVSADFLIKDIQNQAKVLGRIPVLREYEYKSYAIRQFGTWRIFLKQADLIIDTQVALLTEKH